MRWIPAIALVAVALAGCVPKAPSRAALQQRAQDMAIMDQQRQNAIERRLITSEITQDEYQREMAQEQAREQEERDQLRSQARRAAAARRALLDDDPVPTFRPSYNYGTALSAPPVSPSLAPTPASNLCSMMSCPAPPPPPPPKLIPYEAVAPLLPGINSQGFAK